MFISVDGKELVHNIHRSVFDFRASALDSSKMSNLTSEVTSVQSCLIKPVIQQVNQAANKTLSSKDTVIFAKYLSKSRSASMSRPPSAVVSKKHVHIRDGFCPTAIQMSNKDGDER